MIKKNKLIYLAERCSRLSTLDAVKSIKEKSIHYSKIPELNIQLDDLIDIMWELAPPDTKEKCIEKGIQRISNSDYKEYSLYKQFVENVIIKKYEKYVYYHIADIFGLIKQKKEMKQLNIASIQSIQEYYKIHSIVRKAEDTEYRRQIRDLVEPFRIKESRTMRSVSQVGGMYAFDLEGLVDSKGNDYTEFKQFLDQHATTGLKFSNIDTWKYYDLGENIVIINGDLETLGEAFHMDIFDVYHARKDEFLFSDLIPTAAEACLGIVLEEEPTT